MLSSELSLILNAEYFCSAVRVMVMKIDKQDKTQVIDPDFHSTQIEGMPIFKCSCGTRILIVPDLQEMNRAIQAHIIEHKRVTGHRLKEDIIIQLILKAITECVF
jgi:hypothetical protein